MRARILAAAAVAVVAATTLTACRTNVGYAATIEGKRYSESDISDYLTPDAQPITRQDETGAQSAVPSRSFVVETLITEALLKKVANRLPGGAPSSAVLARLRASALGGKSVESVVTGAGIKGYTTAFDNLLVRRVVYSQYLQAASQQGVDVQGAVTKVPFSVSVNPRYGTWDSARRAFDSSVGAGAPAFLKLNSSLASQGDAASGAPAR